MCVSFPKSAKKKKIDSKFNTHEKIAFNSPRKVSDFGKNERGRELWCDCWLAAQLSQKDPGPGKPVAL